MFLNILAFTALLGSCGIAWKWGGLDERLTAAALMFATLASRLAVENNYGHTETGLLIIDVVLLIGLLVLALRSDRFWPMWATAFQFVAVIVHVASLTETGNFAWAYAVALIFWSYPIVIALAAGTWLEARYRNA